MTAVTWATVIMVGAYCVFTGTAVLGTRNRRGGVEIVALSMIFATLASAT
jgi:hypothetical protein